MPTKKRPEDVEEADESTVAPSGHRRAPATLSPFQIGDWEAAEVNAVRWMRHWGFADARRGPNGPDGGIDVRAIGAVAQVKFRAANVTRPDLQRLVGAAPPGELHLLFFTGTGYSREAIEYALGREIALFTYALDGGVVPLNLHADRIVARRTPVHTGFAARNGHDEPEGEKEPGGEDEVTDWAVLVLAFLLGLPLLWPIFALPGTRYALTFWFCLAGYIIYFRISQWWTD